MPSPQALHFGAKILSLCAQAQIRSANGHFSTQYPGSFDLSNEESLEFFLLRLADIADRWRRKGCRHNNGFQITLNKTPTLERGQMSDWRHTMLKLDTVGRR